MNDWQFSTPITLVVLNRPGTTAQVFAKIAEARPSKLLVIAQRVSPVPYHLPHFLSLAAIYLFIVGVTLLNPHLGATVVYKVSALLIFMLSILVTGVITLRQLDNAWQSVRARLQSINLI
jgi:cell division protein FtsW (lipid II flippase)